MLALEDIRADGLRMLGTCVGTRSAREQFLQERTNHAPATVAKLINQPHRHAFLVLRVCIQQNLRHLQRSLKSDDLVYVWDKLDTILQDAVIRIRGLPCHTDHATKPPLKRQSQNRPSQRAHCARRTDYMQTLEERIRQYEAGEIHSNVRLQEVARALKVDNERLKKEVVALKLQLADRAVEQSWEDDRRVLEEQIRGLREQVEVLRKQPRTVKQETAVAERLKHFEFDWSCRAKYSADAPVARLAGGAWPTGLPNEWFNELDDALFKAGDPDRRKLMHKYTNGFDDYADEQWAAGAVKRYREKMNEPVPFKPGSYDPFGGRLAYSVQDLEEYREMLMRASPRGTVDCCSSTPHPLATLKSEATAGVKALD